MIQYDRKIFDILKVINGRVNEGIQKVFEPLDITMPQAMILAAVHHKEAMRMTELAELMKTSCANCSTICQRLEKAGLLNRVRDETDRRVVNLELTDKSKEIIDSVKKKLDYIAAYFLSEASEEEKIKILEGLQILCYYMDKTGETLQ